jgi:putative transposase
MDVVAIALLPDHTHTVWSLPAGDSDYPFRWAQIKEEFTRSFLALGGEEAQVNTSRLRHRERGIWQRRYWEHTCQDEIDLKRCVDYIHWNPVKHGLVKRARDYPWSSFHRFVKEGEYDMDWGRLDPCPDIGGPGWEQSRWRHKVGLAALDPPYGMGEPPGQPLPKLQDAQRLRA